MAVKKKKTRVQEIKELIDPKSQRRFEREAENALIDAEEQAEKRYEWAHELKQFQDHDTTVAINRMTARMAQMAGVPYFRFRGVTLNNLEERLMRIQYKTHLWIAMRLLVAAAEWDLQISNFKLPDARCARCGKKLLRKRVVKNAG